MLIERTIHIGPCFDGGMGVVLLSYQRLFGLPATNCWNSYEGGFIRSLSNMLAILIRILFGKRDDDFICYHLHTSERGSFFRKILFSKAIRFKKQKYVVHMHGGYFQDTFYSASQRTKKQIYDYLANANAIIAISHQMRNFLGKSFDIRDKVTVVPNACETLSEAPIDLAGHSEPVCIVYSGRYNKPKGVFDLLAAFEKAEFKVPVKLDLFGNGEVKKVKAQVTQSSNKDLISVSGWKEHKQYILELKNYDLLVLPSYAETFGLSLVEAMGLGVPVISTTAPAIPEVVKDGETGLLVEAGNIDALAEAIAKVANKKDLRIRLGKNAWADVKERFSPSVVLDKLEHLYSHLQKDSQSI